MLLKVMMDVYLSISGQKVSRLPGPKTAIITPANAAKTAIIIPAKKVPRQVHSEDGDITVKMEFDNGYGDLS